jgi:hypothetical protein
VLCGGLGDHATHYADVLRGKRMCLCGMLAAEYRTLPKPMQNAVIRFFDENEAWLEAVLVQGQDERTLEFTGSASDAARMIVSALEGAMLVSRPYGDPARLRATAARLFAGSPGRPLRPSSPDLAETSGWSELPVEVALGIEEAAGRTSVRVPMVGDPPALWVDPVPVLAVTVCGDMVEMT